MENIFKITVKSDRILIELSDLKNEDVGINSIISLREKLRPKYQTRLFDKSVEVLANKNEMLNCIVEVGFFTGFLTGLARAESCAGETIMFVKELIEKENALIA